MAVNYDPVKAHEYYMQHRKLKGKGNKGKRSTKGFSQTQKEQWDYAKEQLRVEHKGINQNITDNSKARRQELSAQAKEMISELRGRLKDMSKEQKAEWKERIKDMISEVREELRSNKSALTEDTKAQRSQEREDYDVRKDEAYNKIKGMKNGGKKK